MVCLSTNGERASLVKLQSGYVVWPVYLFLKELQVDIIAIDPPCILAKKNSYLNFPEYDSFI